MRADDVRSNEPICHGAYVCLTVKRESRRSIARAAVPALIDRLGFQNEFDPGPDHPAEAVAFLRRVETTPGDVADEALSRADAVVHVASTSAEPVTEFCREIARLLGRDAKPYVIGGVGRPLTFTGNAMYNFAYAHRVLQQPATAMPNAFLLPMRKSEAWWKKGWMERHTYFLPRYDDEGRMVHEGHALAAQAGVPCLLRRTYKHPLEPAPESEYDFVTYFECADADVSTFRDVCSALRDVARNPEWRFVREGPMWRGRRVATWGELFA